MKKKPVSKYELIQPDRLRVPCAEHGLSEEVRQAEYYMDAGYWYMLGLHPRFSILETLAKAEQRPQEISLHLGVRTRDDGSTARDRLDNALRRSKTSKAFLKALHPHLFVDLVTADDSTHRVTNDFKSKYETAAFTVDDFFEEPSQELRRLILRAGASIPKILERMDKVAEDDEGSLWEFKRDKSEDAKDPLPGFTASRRTNYLYVKCPSTGQEYMLGVPGTFTSPKEARRWTFGLRPDAQFIDEA